MINNKSKNNFYSSNRQTGLSASLKSGVETPRALKRWSEAMGEEKVRLEVEGRRLRKEARAFAELFAKGENELLESLRELPFLTNGQIVGVDTDAWHFVAFEMGRCLGALANEMEAAHAEAAAAAAKATATASSAEKAGSTQGEESTTTTSTSNSNEEISSQEYDISSPSSGDKQEQKQSVSDSLDAVIEGEYDLSDKKKMLPRTHYSFWTPDAPLPLQSLKTWGQALLWVSLKFLELFFSRFFDSFVVGIFSIFRFFFFDFWILCTCFWY